MTSQDKLIRETDGEIFYVVELAHWSTIRSASGEEYSVKWLGGDQYIGREGPVFRLLKEK